MVTQLPKSDLKLCAVLLYCPDDNGTFVAYVPAIPGCHAWGQTLDEARAEIANVFEMIKEEYADEGRSLPTDVELVITNVG
ncbi:type II toxin-antitoxin system HicB family antitoxin [Brunnivagina elsteri]|uniref:HicB family protein n=1 Tax=Brunnivagina elsteri CCALA 953 TaxID=987040 RepID=A0A2A2TII7_9CYAN|nr:type II toxin-antitoxin system HicB family antitoxin [Calothrix elsteri]PAX53219.1 HicB family protein [Calothrix elsteri CCALA 953]